MFNRLEANQNKNNCLLSNFLDKLKSPALFSHLFRSEKSARNFNLSKKLLTKQLFLFCFASSNLDNSLAVNKQHCV